MKKRFLTLLICVFSFAHCFSKENTKIDTTKANFFMAYELGEAVFNDFKSISGEIGIHFKNNHQLRVAHMNVKLTEKHLSSDFAGAVQGNNVEGSFLGFEGFYDIPILWNTLYLSPSAGYYINKYNHTILNESIENKSWTLGTALSYRELDIFKIPGLYYTVSLPFRITLNQIDDIPMGNATIKNNRFDNNIWLFIGYQFN